MQFTELVVTREVINGLPQVESLSSDGRYLLYKYSTNDGDTYIIRRQDLETGRDVYISQVQPSTTSSAMTKDGRYILTLTPWSLRERGIWNESPWELRDMRDGGSVIDSREGGGFSLSDDARFITYYGPTVEPGFDRVNHPIRVLDRWSGRDLSLERRGPPVTNGSILGGTTTTVPQAQKLLFHSSPIVSGDGTILTSSWRGSEVGLGTPSYPDYPIGLVQYSTETLEMVRSLPAGSDSGSVQLEPLAVSPDGRYVVGKRFVYPSPELFWADMQSGRLETIPRSVGNQLSNQVRIADDGSWVLFFSIGDWDLKKGPSSDGTFDVYGYYRADITSTGVTVVGLSGASSLIPTNASGSVVATGDGRVAIFASAFAPKPVTSMGVAKASVGAQAKKKPVRLVVAKRVRVPSSSLKSPTVTLRQPITARFLATRSKLKVASTSTLSLKVWSSSSKYCKVSGSKLVGIRPGRCNVSVIVTPKKGRAMWVETTVIVKR